MKVGWGFTEDARVRGVELDALHSIFAHSDIVPFFSKIKKRKRRGKRFIGLGMAGLGHSPTGAILGSERGSSGHWGEGPALPDP